MGGSMTPVTSVTRKTLAQQLSDVQEAIATAESAQSVAGGGRSRTMGDLATLYRREKDLLNRIVQGTRGTARLAEF